MKSYRKLSRIFHTLHVLMLFCFVLLIQSNWNNALASETAFESIPLFSDYLVINCCRKGLVVWKDNFTQGIVNNQGKWILPPVYSEIRCNDDGVVTYSPGSGWEFYDWDGNQLYETDVFEEAYPFSCGYAVVMDMDCNFYYIDQTGALLMDTAFEGAQSFDMGYACAIWSGQYYIISTTGDFVAGPFDNCQHIIDGVYLCEHGEDSYYLDFVSGLSYTKKK